MKIQFNPTFFYNAKYLPCSWWKQIEDGGTLVTKDRGTLVTKDRGTLVTKDGGTLVTKDGPPPNRNNCKILFSS